MPDAPSFGAYSNWRAAGELVFTAGHVGVDADGNPPASVGEETALALRALAETLREAGSSLGSLLQVRCLLSDMADFAEFDAAYREAVPAPFPPRVTHGAELVAGLRVEIVAVAAREAAGAETRS